MSSEQTIEEFLNQFEERFGTQPEVTGLIVEEPVPANEGGASRRAAPTVLASGAAVFDAPALSLPQGESESNLPPTTRGGETMAAAAVDWRPNDAEFSITPQSGRADFFHSYWWWWWYDRNTPQMIPAQSGAEFEVNLYNDAPYLNHRPNCRFEYKDAFWGKTYSWNRAVMRPD